MIHSITRNDFKLIWSNHLYLNKTFSWPFESTFQVFRDMPYIKLVINIFVIFSHALFDLDMATVVALKIFILLFCISPNNFSKTYFSIVFELPASTQCHYESCNFIWWLVKKWIREIFGVMSKSIISAITT